MQKSLDTFMSPHQVTTSNGHEYDGSFGVDPKVCHSAYKVASKIATNMESYSQVIDSSRENALPRFDRNEIVLGDLLGEGGFNNVFEVHQLDIDEDSFHYSMVQQERRLAFAERASKGKYAVKLLQLRVMEDKEDYCNAAADLVIETKILASLEPHRNIIQLHGVSSAGAAGFAEGIEGGYFLIVDRLQDTLTKRIQTWSRTDMPLTDRLFYALELSSALKHLHKFNIVFRDLKPDNVGFDCHGILKLFDFGLAKELNPQELNSQDTYEMSGETGSRRYMAPEVARNEPYSLGADVYSYGVLLWQICSLQEPFAGMTLERHYDAVVLSHERPFINPAWPAKVGNIIKWCWAEDQYVRPPLKEVHRALKRQIKERTQPIRKRPTLEKTKSIKSFRDLVPDSKPEKNCHNMSFSSLSATEALKTSLYHKEALSSFRTNTKSNKDATSSEEAAPSRTLSSFLGRKRRSAPSDILKAAVALANAGVDGTDFATKDG